MRRSENTALLFAYIRRGRKALTLLDSQPCPVARPLAMDVSAVGRPARGLCFGLGSYDPVQQPWFSDDRVEHDHVSIAMNIVHVYTHP